MCGKCKANFNTAVITKEGYGVNPFMPKDKTKCDKCGG